MALARIITRSETCSQELALVLVARGYTVEIVSPDKVPNNIADLELRVDAGSGDELIANVEAHRGERTASLKFVHHLKAPLLDFPRRPSEFDEAALSSDEPVSFNTESGIETTELPARILLLPHRAHSPAVEPLPNREHASEIDPEIDPGINPTERVRLIAPQFLLPPEEPPVYFAVEDTAGPQPAMAAGTPATAQRMPPMAQETIVPLLHAAQLRNLFAGWTFPSRSVASWQWRAALAFASLVLLAVVLGFGARHSSKAAEKSSGVSPVGGIVASTGVTPSRAVGAEGDPTAEPGQISSVPRWPATSDSESDSSHALKQAQIAKPAIPTANPRTSVSGKRDNDLIARDTVIYFDRHLKPVPKAKRAKPIARQRRDPGQYR
jgi:hypothetical protein